jgi:hypothetical protein
LTARIIGAVFLATAVGALRAGAATGPTTVVVANGQQVGPIGLGGGYLVWEQGGRQQPVPTVLEQRDLRTGRVRVLGSGVSPESGVASTAGWVIYARQVGPYTRLLAVSHDGMKRLTLSHWLVAPLAARGDRVAWAEQNGSKQRIVVRKMATGAGWRAASLPRCIRRRCYRIDAVTLADRGVVFDRGAVGSQPSLIVRRAFGASRLQTTPIPGDPQPELASSATGAYYYAFGRGWFRWDFGAARPHSTGLGPGAPSVVAAEGGRLLQVRQSGCRTSLALRLGGRRVVPLTAPVRLSRVPRDSGPLCEDFAGFAWSGRSLLVAWAIQPKAFDEAHTDVGLVGAVTRLDF